MLRLVLSGRDVSFAKIKAKQYALLSFYSYFHTIKTLCFYILLFISVSAFSQEFSNYSIQELEQLKNEAVNSQDYLKAEKIKNEIEIKKKQKDAKIILQEQLAIAVQNEEYLTANDLKKKIELYDAIDILEMNKAKAIATENYKEADKIKQQINNVKISLGLNSADEIKTETVHQNDLKVVQTDTLFYSENWKGVGTYNECTYYRILNFNSNDQIINPVNDFFKSGKLEGIGFAEYIDSENDKNSIWSGIVKVFDENGRETFAKDYSAIKKEFYSDGDAYQYYNHDSIIISVNLERKKLYGNYYTALITIANAGSQSFLFDPSDIEIIFENGVEHTYGEVLTHHEYMNKVSNRQAWNNALTAWGEMSAASKAGYSSSSYSSTTYGRSSTKAAGAYAYKDNQGYAGYGKAVGVSSSNSTYTTHGNVNSYDGGAAYQANQNARRNINDYANHQYQIAQNINSGYLKKNTIFSSQQIYGSIMAKYEKAESIYLRIKIKGYTYTFNW